MTGTDIEAKRALNNGFGDALSRAFEFAVTPAIFGVLGFWVDGRTHTTPLFTLVFALGTLSWVFVKMFRDYDEKMKAEEAKAPWGKP